MLKAVLFGFAFLSVCVKQVPQPLAVNLIDKTNHAEIIFFKGKQPCAYKTSKKIDLIFLKDLVLKSRNRRDLKCDSTGEIIYFKDKIQLLEVYFSTRETGSKYKSTGTVVFNMNGQKIRTLFNYGTGMLVNEEYYQLHHNK